MIQRISLSLCLETRLMWKKVNARCVIIHLFTLICSSLSRTGYTETCHDLVSIERQHSVFRNIGEGSYQC
jgi:hypothetical protein